MARGIQLFLRKILIKRYVEKYKHIWPIDEKAKNRPVTWNGWPDQKQFALVLTHDVETGIGQEKCRQLMEVEASLGFRSSFNFVPKRYDDDPKLRDYLKANKFEVGVHGLYHDGKLFKSRKEFLRRANHINRFMEEWKAVGFRAPAMHHNLDWIHDLDLEYDSSTFDTDPFEPQPDGVRTIFPFFVEKNSTYRGYIELPYTLPQDHTLFIIMKEKDIFIWKKKVDWIAKNGGMALLNTHPDYMNFKNNKLKIDEYPVSYYEDLLLYIQEKYEGNYWHVLPKDIAHYWMKNIERKLK